MVGYRIFVGGVVSEHTFIGNRVKQEKKGNGEGTGDGRLRFYRE
jgi:hypothetical protein